MVSTQKVLVLALAATAVVFQGCDDDSAPKNNHRHNNNNGRAPTQQRDNHGGLSSFNRRRRNNGNQNNRQNNDPLDGNQQNNRHDQHQDRNQNDQGKGGNGDGKNGKGKDGNNGEGKGKDGQGKGKGNDELPPPPPRAASSSAILKEIKEKFESRLKFNYSSKQNGGTFGDIHIAKITCQDGARDIVVKIPSKLEEHCVDPELKKYIQEESEKDAANLEIVRGSPYFPQIYATIKSPDGFTSTIMESLDKDLAKIHESLLDMPTVANRFHWAMQLLQGLKVLHDKGFIHKDLKPANVMLSGPVAAQDTELRLIDLGSLCSVTSSGEDACLPGALGGTTPFFAPAEYFEPRTWGMLSAANKKKYDVWAAGLIVLKLFGLVDPGRDIFGERIPDVYENYVPHVGQNGIFHFENLATDDALDHFEICTNSFVRDLLKRMLSDKVEDRATIDEAIQLLKIAMDNNAAVRNMPAVTPVLTEQRKGPKCLQSCYDGNCLAQCHVKSGFEVGRVSKVQNDQCVEPPKPVQPYVQEKHHFQEL